MTRGPQHAGRGKGKPSAKPALGEPLGREPTAAPTLDLGIALSVYGKTPCGELVEIDAACPVPPELTTWSTEQ